VTDENTQKTTLIAASMIAATFAPVATQTKMAICIVTIK
jgi:hypothetical protein